jgi:hypothetical protein
MGTLTVVLPDTPTSACLDAEVSPRECLNFFFFDLDGTKVPLFPTACKLLLGVSLLISALLEPSSMSIPLSCLQWELTVVLGESPIVPGEVLATAGRCRKFAADERARFIGMIPGKLLEPVWPDKDLLPVTTGEGNPRSPPDIEGS